VDQAYAEAVAPSSSGSAEVDGVVRANGAFYDAFERGDIDAMSELWEHSDRVVCTHPGWSALRGWASVSSSWFALFNNGQGLQFIVTNVQASVAGVVGWVSCDENILGATASGTVAAFNLFARDGDRWRMVAHHASPVATRS
jgi:ketosteroid isomerase-like protein